MTDNNVTAENEKYEISNLSQKDLRQQVGVNSISRQTWSVREIYEKIDNKTLNLDPSYQRKSNLWKDDKKVQFIESLLVGIIVPPIYIVEIGPTSKLGITKYEIVDGKQRLGTLNEFLNSKLKLDEKNLGYFKDIFNGLTYNDIDLLSENDFEVDYIIKNFLSNVLDVYVIKENMPDFLKYDIFARINQGSEKLQTNELRRAIYASKLINHIDNYIDKLYGAKKTPSTMYKQIFSQNDYKRFKDCGYYYSFIAFYYRTDLTSKSVIGYNSRPKDMIDGVLNEFATQKIVFDESLINKILDLSTELLINLEDLKKKYIIESSIKMYVDGIISKEGIVKVSNSGRYQATLISSQTTTSNVDTRIKLMINYEI